MVRRTRDSGPARKTACKRRHVRLFLLVVLISALAACGGRATTAPVKATLPRTTGTPAKLAGTPEPSQAPKPAETREPVQASRAGAQTWQCPESQATISIWHGWQGDYLDNVSTIFGEYQALCPNVKLDLVYQPDLDYAIQTAQVAGEGPDIFPGVNEQIGRDAEAGIIAPLDRYIARDEFGESFVPTAVRAVTYLDQVWCYPESMEAITMIYNSDLIKEDELPKDTDELLRRAEAWKSKHADGYYFVYDAAKNAYFSAPWWQGAGVTIMDEEGKNTFASDAGYAAGDFIAALRRVMPQEIDYGMADNLFREQRKAPITLNGPWYTADLDAAGINYGLKQLPIFSPTGKPAQPFVVVKCLMLTASADKRGVSQAAVNLMQYYTSKASQVRLAKANRIVPASAQAAMDPEVQALPVVAAFGKQASLGNPIPNTPYMEAMWGPLAHGVECIWNSVGDVRACVEGIAAEAEENVTNMR